MSWQHPWLDQVPDLRHRDKVNPMTYRVPYKLTTSRGAATKARIVYATEPDILWLEFTARTQAEAREALQELILNGDPRPVMGRSSIGEYAVKEPSL